jgi:hypothetical protein
MNRDVEFRIYDIDNDKMVYGVTVYGDNTGIGIDVEKWNDIYGMNGKR